MVLAVIIKEDAKGNYAPVGNAGALSDVKAAYRELCDAGGGGAQRLLLLTTRGLEKQRKFRPQSKDCPQRQPQQKAAAAKGKK